MRNRLIYFALILILQACSSSKQDSIVPDTTPSKAELTTPAQNSICVTGTVISDTQSSVTFSWNAAEHANSYDLVVKNLLTATTVTLNTTQTQVTTNLSRATPYSWYIVSKSATINKTAQSDTWKFYNSGSGAVTYAPFPAEITAPTYAQVVPAGTVNLTWKGSSVETGTIVDYDVYFGTSTAPALLKSKVSDSFINDVSVTSGNQYYWKVITRDNNGNTSDSGLYVFTTN